jgi:hypothetical protein
MTHNYCGHDLRWDGNLLRLRSGRILARIEPDTTWPGMWRVKTPDGSYSDMVNRTRAKDAAISLILAALYRRYQAAA